MRDVHLDNGAGAIKMEPTKDREELLVSIHKKVNEMHPVLMVELPRMQVLIERIAIAQNNMSDAAIRMSITHEHAEKRFSKLEDRLQEANDKASGKGQIPLLSHYLVVGSMILVVVLVVLYVNKQTMDATLTSISVGNAKTQHLIEEELKK